MEKFLPCLIPDKLKETERRRDFSSLRMPKGRLLFSGLGANLWLAHKEALGHEIYMRFVVLRDHLYLLQARRLIRLSESATETRRGVGLRCSCACGDCLTLDSVPVRVCDMKY